MYMTMYLLVMSFNLNTFHLFMCVYYTYTHTHIHKCTYRSV